MLNTEDDILSLLNDDRKLKKLFFLEKKKRGKDINKLIFLGASNIAAYKWCSIKSILKSKKEELMFFRKYLYDRLVFAIRLNMIKKLPRDNLELLETGDEITLHGIENIINKEQNTSEKNLFKELAISNGSTIMDLSEAPWQIRGIILEGLVAEKHPSISWNFKWNDYVIICIPDGISHDSIYEFKTTKNRYLLNFIKPVAFAQADLYGYFFRRKKKKVQILIMEERKTESWESEIDDDNALDILQKFSLAEENEFLPPPKEWKCKVCEFNKTCPLYKN